jgi:hypothetical protein
VAQQYSTCLANVKSEFKPQSHQNKKKTKQNQKQLKAGSSGKVLA